jgi:hypothetical protein
MPHEYLETMTGMETRLTENHTGYFINDVKVDYFAFEAERKHQKKVMAERTQKFKAFLTETQTRLPYSQTASKGK